MPTSLFIFIPQRNYKQKAAVLAYIKPLNVYSYIFFIYNVRTFRLLIYRLLQLSFIRHKL